MRLYELFDGIFESFNTFAKTIRWVDSNPEFKGFFTDDEDDKYYIRLYFYSNFNVPKYGFKKIFNIQFAVDSDTVVNSIKMTNKRKALKVMSIVYNESFSKMKQLLNGELPNGVVLSISKNTEDNTNEEFESRKSSYSMIANKVKKDFNYHHIYEIEDNKAYSYIIMDKPFSDTEWKIIQNSVKAK